MASSNISEPSTFIDKIINGGIGYLKYYYNNINNSSTIETPQTIKLLRWWCNCKPTKIELPQETTYVKDLANGISESLEAVKHVAEDFSESFVLPEVDESTQTLLQTLIKFAVLLLFIGCVLYILSGIKRKMVTNSHYRTNTGITSKITSFVTSKTQDS